MIDHDRLFKELIATFFIDFLELFFPQVVEYLKPDSLTFLEKEIFTDVTDGEQYEADLVAKIQFRQQEIYFLIHIENQSYNQQNFGRRMFRYFARLSEKYALPIYPIAIFSFDAPRTPQTNIYRVEFPDKTVLTFDYGIVQLNQLNWRDFLEQKNAIASALMAKMNIATEDRPKVKAECLRLLATLRLNPAKMKMISGFVDTYLKLSQAEEKVFQAQISKLELVKQFDTAVTTAGGTVNTDLLSGLGSGNTWDRGDYTITSTDGSNRSIDSSYLANLTGGGTSGDTIGIDPYAPPDQSGLTFTFDNPVNAFGLEIGDWATCCAPSALYIAFDGGAVRQVAVANSPTDNPGFAKLGDYENFVGAVDDTDEFTTVTFYGDGFGEYLVAGGTIRYATVPKGSFTAVPEPASILGLMLFGGLTASTARRRNRTQK